MVEESEAASDGDVEIVDEIDMQALFRAMSELPPDLFAFFLQLLDDPDREPLLDSEELFTDEPMAADETLGDGYAPGMTLRPHPEFAVRVAAIRARKIQGDRA